MVCDTGIVMNPGTMEKIFEPFYTTKEPAKGTGLGLAMAYGIVKQHGGFINVYSEPDNGTTFRLYFPATESKEQAPVKSAIEPLPAGGTETILVAEDDEKLRRLSEIVLMQNGYKVILANDGAEAVNKFIDNKESIQLVILDMIMRKKGGKEVYDEIKRIRSDVKVLFTSGDTAERMDTDMMLKDRINVITKPISPRNLLNMTRAVLDAPLAV
jgi:polar amino acid transport system substrate-binding protein